MGRRGLDGRGMDTGIPARVACTGRMVDPGVNVGSLSRTAHSARLRFGLCGGVGALLFVAVLGAAHPLSAGCDLRLAGALHLLRSLSGIMGLDLLEIISGYRHRWPNGGLATSSADGLARPCAVAIAMRAGLGGTRVPARMAVHGVPMELPG